MAITVTDAFKAAWLNKTWVGWRRDVRIKRRYWDGADFVVEAAWQTLRQDQIKRVEPIPQSVDAEFEAIFQISEFNIDLASPNGEFLVSTAFPSFWAADDVSGELGYEAVRSEVEVLFTLVLQDDTEETITLFSGVIIEDPEQNSEGLTATIQVSSNARLIADSDADQVSDPVTLENCSPAVGDGVETAFATTSKGVAAVDDLQVDATSLTQGRDNDWTVDKVGEDVPAEFDIRTTPPPGIGETVKWSGRTWKQNISVEDFVDAVLDNANFPAGKREISPVIIPGGLAGFKRVTDQAEWEAGTVTDIDTTTVPGSISKQYMLDDFNDGVYTGWTVQSGSWSAASLALVATGAGVISLPVTVPSAFAMEVKIACASGAIFWVQSSAADENGNGYALLIDFDTVLGVPSTTLYLVRYTAGVATTLGSYTISASAHDTAQYTYRVSRTALGAFTVSKDGTPLITATDTTYTSGSYVVLRTLGAGDSFDDLRFDDKAAVTYESEEFDLLSVPTSFGALDHTEDLNGGSISKKTNAAAASGGPYDGWTAIAAVTNAIESTPRQYFKVQMILTPSGVDFESPSVEVWRANFNTQSVFISVANLEGLDSESGGGWAAIERYVGPTGYALALRGNGNIALRPKDQLGAAVADLTQDNCLIKILSFDPGSKRVRNVGRVRYGGYVHEYDGAAAGEAEPTSEQRFGRKAKETNYDRILFANDVNIGEAQAQLDYENGFERHRRWSFQCYLVPWLESLDRVTITFLRDPLAANPRPGDKLLDGQPGYRIPVAGTPLNPKFVNAQLCRILGWTPDVERPKECVLYVEEILDD